MTFVKRNIPFKIKGIGKFEDVINQEPFHALGFWTTNSTIVVSITGIEGTGMAKNTIKMAELL